MDTGERRLGVFEEMQEAKTVYKLVGAVNIPQQQNVEIALGRKNSQGQLAHCKYECK